MHGLVVRNTGYSYTVKSDAGEVFDCKVKGNFRIRGIRTTNPVAIGDGVTFTPYEQQTLPSPSLQGGSGISANEETNEQGNHPLPVGRVRGGSVVGSGLITAIDDRKNYIIRKSTNLSKQSHIIAANVDMCFLIITIQQPETPLQFIDRFLASAEAYSVPVTLVFNKIDLIDDEWKDYLDGVINLYETIGYPCRRISALTGEGVEELRAELQGRITLLSGNSGVGKSTLINTLFPHLHLRTSDISDAYNTGKHTTTFSEMYEVEQTLPSSQTLPSPSLQGGGRISGKEEDNVVMNAETNEQGNHSLPVGRVRGGSEGSAAWTHLQVGDTVTHKSFGKGVVKSIDERFIIVAFARKESRFPYPWVFEQGYMSV